MKEINCLNLCDIWGQATKDKKKIIEYFYLSERLKGKNKEINKEK